MRYGERIVRVVAETSGQRAIIESVDDSGRTFRSAVKWTNLTELNDPLFGRLPRCNLTCSLIAVM
jgi:hypothetical protein